MKKPIQLVRYRDLEETFGIPWSRSHILRLEKAGKFPKRVPIGANYFGYVRDEVVAYIDDKIKARDVPHHQSVY